MSHYGIISDELPKYYQLILPRIIKAQVEMIKSILVMLIYLFLLSTIAWKSTIDKKRKQNSYYKRVNNWYNSDILMIKQNCYIIHLKTIIHPGKRKR